MTSMEFSAEYDVERVEGVSTLSPEYEFRQPPAPSSEGIDLWTSVREVVYEVRPWEGDAWAGRFQGGGDRYTGVFTTPSPNTVCIVVDGEGYWVPVLAPQTFEIIRSTPIKQVRPILDAGILLFVDFTGVAAYGADGLRWVTDDLSWDGIEITDVTATAVHGTGWDAPENRRVPFVIDLQSGKTEGGSSPAMYGT